MIKNFHYRNFILPFKPLDVPMFYFSEPQPDGAQAMDISSDQVQPQDSIPETRTFEGSGLPILEASKMRHPKPKRLMEKSRKSSGPAAKAYKRAVPIYSGRSPEDVADKVLRQYRHDGKRAFRAITAVANRFGRKCPPMILEAKEMIRQRSQTKFSSAARPAPLNFYFNRVMPSPVMPQDSSTQARAGVVNQTVMLPITSRNREVLFDTLSMYPPDIQIAMADYYIGQALASVEEYFWLNGFFKTHMDHVSWLAKWSDMLARNANIDYVSQVLSHLGRGPKYL